MALTLPWCRVHHDRGNPNFNNHSCWTGTRGEIEATPCDMTTMRLVPDDTSGLTADIIEKALATPERKWSRGTIMDAAVAYSRILADG